MANKALLNLWTKRLAFREKRLRNLKASKSPKPKQIQLAEYKVLVARRNVAKQRKLLAGQHLTVHKPKVQVDRREHGNVHGRLHPSVIVLHSTESHDRPGTSDVEGILKYLENTADGLGIHWVVDQEGNVGQGANLNQMVYHAKGANSFSVGIEQIGFAHSTEWKRKDRLAQLDKVAKLLAYMHKELGIPLKRSISHGIALHRDFPAGGHSDPGTEQEYPIHYVIRLAQHYAAKGW